jgi:hypothetical protein
LDAASKVFREEIRETKFSVEETIVQVFGLIAKSISVTMAPSISS